MVSMSLMPSEARNCGTPVLKMTMAMAMHMPRKPHTIMRGSTPKPGLL